MIALLLLWAAAALAADPAATLELKVFDERGKPAPARAHLVDAAGKAQPFLSPSQVLIHPRFPQMGVVVPGSAALAVPPGRFSLVVERGHEYRRLTLPIEAAAGSTIRREARLSRWIDMAARGWWSGDTHVHRKPEEMPGLVRAADIYFAPTVTKWNDRSILDEWPAQPMFTVDGNRYFSVNNSEDERPWGAVMFLGMRAPIATYPFKQEYPTPVQTWGEARKQGAFIDLEKLIWWAAPVMAALEPPDTFGVAVNHFREDSVMENEAWGRPRDKTTYAGAEGFARYIFYLYGLFQNCGMRVAASAGSANGVLQNPVGYNRSYVHLGNSFTPAAWLEGQKAGRNFVTNGPMLFLTVDGAMPGQVLPEKKSDYLVRVEALTAGAIEKLEIVVDGAPVNTFVAMSSGERSRMNKSALVPVKSGGWVAARCLERAEGNARFAHTSPVYVGSQPKRSPAALALMREWIDEYIARVDALPETALSKEQKAEWLESCRKAREWYQ